MGSQLPPPETFVAGDQPSPSPGPVSTCAPRREAPRQRAEPTFERPHGVWMKGTASRYGHGQTSSKRRRPTYQGNGQNPLPAQYFDPPLLASHWPWEESIVNNVNEFTVSLPAGTWEENTGWPCEALSIPGARLSRLVVGGRIVSLKDVTCTGVFIQYKGLERKADAAATIEINKRLITLDTAIIVALIGLLGTVISAAVTYVIGKNNKPDEHPTPQVHPCGTQDATGCWWGDSGQRNDNEHAYGSMCCRNDGSDVFRDGQPRGYLKAGNNWFICQAQWPGRVDPNSGDARIDWWVYTQADSAYANDSGQGWGWIPASKIVGANQLPIPNLRTCDSLPEAPSKAP